MVHVTYHPSCSRTPKKSLQCLFPSILPLSGSTQVCLGTCRASFILLQGQAFWCFLAFPSSAKWHFLETHLFSGESVWICAYLKCNNVIIVSLSSSERHQPLPLQQHKNKPEGGKSKQLAVVARLWSNHLFLSFLYFSLANFQISYNAHKWLFFKVLKQNSPVIKLN